MGIEGIKDELVIGLGEALWDMLPEGKKIGGAPANFAFHVGQCGLNSCVISAIGDDKLGSEIIENFEEKKLNYLLEVVDYPTGTVQVTLDEQGMPMYEIKEGVAWDNIPPAEKIMELAAKTRCVSFGSLGQRSATSRETIQKFLDAIPQDGKRFIVFDVNLRQNFYTPETLVQSMERANIMKINDEELVTLSRIYGYPGIDLKDKCWLLLGKYSLKALVLTCGINGSYIFTPGHISFMPTPMVEVADTVGAGDAFSAAFMASILQGCTVPEAHANAVAISAYVCTQQGAMPTLPRDLVERTNPKKFHI